MRGIKMTCHNCGGHTKLYTRYGECDYCGSPLVVALPIAEISTVQKRDSLQDEILSVLRANKYCTVSDITSQLREPVPMQKVSAILRTMIQNGTVTRGEEKRKAIFFAKGA